MASPRNLSTSPPYFSTISSILLKYLFIIATIFSGSCNFSVRAVNPERSPKSIVANLFSPSTLIREGSDIIFSTTLFGRYFLNTDNAASKNFSSSIILFSPIFNINNFFKNFKEKDCRHYKK